MLRGVQQIGANILESCATRCESIMVVPIYMEESPVGSTLFRKGARQVL